MRVQDVGPDLIILANQIPSGSVLFFPAFKDALHTFELLLKNCHLVVEVI